MQIWSWQALMLATNKFRFALKVLDLLLELLFGTRNVDILFNYLRDMGSCVAVFTVDELELKTVKY